MRSTFRMFSTSALIAVGVGVVGAAHASNEATNNQCWGDLAHQMGQKGLMGIHSAASSPFNGTPENPRIGVANQGRFLETIGVIDEGDPGEGGQGNHAIAVGSIAFLLLDGNGQPIGGPPLLCDGTPGNPGPAAVP